MGKVNTDKANDQQTISLARANAFLDEARKLQQRADKLLEARDHKGSVLASRQSMESCAKAVCVLVDVPFAKKHYFEEKTIEEALGKIPGPMALQQNYLRLFLLANLWSQLPTLAQYPFAYQQARKDLAQVVREQEPKWRENMLRNAFGQLGIYGTSCVGKSSNDPPLHHGSHLF